MFGGRAKRGRFVSCVVSAFAGKSSRGLGEGLPAIPGGARATSPRSKVVFELLVKRGAKARAAAVGVTVAGRRAALYMPKCNSSTPTPRAAYSGLVPGSTRAAPFKDDERRLEGAVDQAVALFPAPLARHVHDFQVGTGRISARSEGGGGTDMNPVTRAPASMTRNLRLEALIRSRYGLHHVAFPPHYGQRPPWPAFSRPKRPWAWTRAESVCLRPCAAVPEDWQDHQKDLDLTAPPCRLAQTLFERFDTTLEIVMVQRRENFPEQLDARGSRRESHILGNKC